MSAFELGGARESGNLSAGEFGVQRAPPAQARRYSSTSQMQAPAISPPYAASPRRPDIVGHAPLQSPQESSAKRASMPPRTVTYEELSARHKAKIKQLQQPVTETLRAEVDGRDAKADYDGRRAAERVSMQPPRPRKDSGQLGGHGLKAIPAEDPLVKAARWRQSVRADSNPSAEGSPTRRSAGSTASPNKEGPLGTQPTTNVQGKRVSRGPHQFIN